MARAGDVTAVVDAAAGPCLDGAGGRRCARGAFREGAAEPRRGATTLCIDVDQDELLLADAQTSGGLLVR